MAAFTFKCKFCNSKIEAENSDIGKSSECPYCKKQIQIMPDANTMVHGKKKSVFPVWCQIILAVILLANIVIASFMYLEHYKTWQYAVVWVDGSSSGKFSWRGISTNDLRSDLSLYADWELVGTVTQIETVHPNFGDSNYVTGLQPNTRSAGVFLIFKKAIYRWLPD